MTWHERLRARLAHYVVVIRWRLRALRCWFRPHRVKFGSHPFCIHCGRNVVDNRRARG